MHDLTEQVKNRVRVFLGLLIAHPLITVAAVGAWGGQAVGIIDPAIAFVTGILGWLFTAAFYGLIAAHLVRKERLTWRTVLFSIRRLTVGTIVSTMVYTIPFLILIPVVDWLVGGTLQGHPLVIILGFSPTVVPSIVAPWSLAVRQSSLYTALTDGLAMIKGNWTPALLAGLGYQTVAYGAQTAREWLIPAGFIPLALLEILWIGIQGVFHLWILHWLFTEVREQVPSSPKTRS